MNILDLLQQSGITAKRVSGTKGGEYASPCPACQGTDRFRCWPAQGDGGKWWCRQCGKGGDLIQYLREFKGLGYKEACLLLGREPNQSRTTLRNQSPSGRGRPVSWRSKETQAPGDQWIFKASSLVEWGERQLWSESQIRVIEWLRSRGISETAIRQARLGWNPKDVWIKRALWGLPEELKENGQPKKLWIPAGLIIPCFRQGTLHRIRVRRSDDDPRYYVLPGSSSASMILGTVRGAFIIVESELDGMLVQQEASDQVGVIALGSANVRPDREACEQLLNADLILVSLDSDDAGARESWRWWGKRFPKSKRWPVVLGKDPSDAYQRGLDIRSWIQAGLAYSLGAVQSDPSVPDRPASLLDANSEVACALITCGRCRSFDGRWCVAERSWDGKRGQEKDELHQCMRFKERPVTRELVSRTEHARANAELSAV